MTVEQLSIFLENKTGRSYNIAEILAKADIDLISFNISETTDYGLLRIIVNDPEKAKEVFKKNNIVFKSTPIIVIEVPNVPGGMYKALQVFKENEIDIRYLYAFVGNHPNKAIAGIKVENTEESLKILKNSNITLLSLKDLL